MPAKKRRQREAARKAELDSLGPPPDYAKFKEGNSACSLNEALLADLAVEPKRLLELGYQFRHPDLPGAFTALLASSADGGEP